ncbi:MAG: hypothetical protein K6G89_09640 [Clostridia bacterium]|nr:hypothetical protein [Clostridia bacterium]
MDISEKVNENMITVTEAGFTSSLPDLMTLDSGKKVITNDDWTVRRKELIKTAVELQYGELPPEPELVEVTKLHTCQYMKSPYIHMHTFLVKTGTIEKPFRFKLQVIIPDTDGEKHPVIVDGDQCWSYYMSEGFLAAALSKGIGWALFDRTVIADDVNGKGRRNGLIFETYEGLDCGALMAWAWGYKRAADALLKTGLPVDLNMIAFSGHSRGGKTALLAGILDERASIVNPNGSGAGGAGCCRFEMKGQCEGGDPFRSETVDDLLNVFPFWFGPELMNYKGRADELPFDEHFLKALVAPRTLFISEAADDIWANPLGTLATTRAAEPAFKLLGAEDNVFWYWRPGKHSHTHVDIEMLANVILHKRDRAPLDGRMFAKPFREELIKQAII